MLFLKNQKKTIFGWLYAIIKYIKYVYKRLMGTFLKMDKKQVRNKGKGEREDREIRKACFSSFGND